MVFCSLAKTSRKPKKKVQTHGQGLGRGLAGDMGLNCFFSWFFAVWPKPRENQKKQKVQTHGQGLGRGLAGDMGLNFFLFFPWFFAVWPKPRENQKNNKSSDPWARSGERPGRGHGSELFFFHGFLQFGQNLEKTKKKQKVQTHGQGLWRGLAGDMGLIFFPWFFCMFFMWRCFHHSTSQKMRVSTICTPAPPMSTPSV